MLADQLKLWGAANVVQYEAVLELRSRWAEVRLACDSSSPNVSE